MENLSISIIIPTFNERINITRLVKSIELSIEKHIHEIIIVDSPLSTEKITDLKLSDKTKIVVSQKGGRASQMNFGASIASGNVLQFIHADSIMPLNFSDEIISAIHEGHDSGCFTYKFDSASLLLKINSVFTHLPFLWCRGGDQAIFVKKDIFFGLGAFNENYSIMEDYEFLKKLMSNSRFSKFKIIRKSITVSSRKYLKNSWLKVQIANFRAMRMFYSGKFSPDQIKEFYQKTLKI